MDYQDTQNQSTQGMVRITKAFCFCNLTKFCQIHHSCQNLIVKSVNMACFYVFG